MSKLWQNSEDKAVILHLTFMKQVRKNNFPGHYGKNGPSPKLFIPKKKTPLMRRFFPHHSLVHKNT